MSEEQAQQLMYQMQMLESFYNEILQKENSLVNVFHEASTSVESIKNIQPNTDSDTLVPIGMATYLKTKVSGNDKFILHVGAGVHIEKDKDSAINYLESRLKEIEVALKDTISQKNETINRLEQGKRQMNQMISATNSNQSSIQS